MEVRCLNKDCPYKGKFNDFKLHHAKICKINGLDNWMEDIKESMKCGIVKRKLSSDDEGNN